MEQGQGQRERARLPVWCIISSACVQHSWAFPVPGSWGQIMPLGRPLTDRRHSRTAFEGLAELSQSVCVNNRSGNVIRADMAILQVELAGVLLCTLHAAARGAAVRVNRWGLRWRVGGSGQELSDPASSLGS